jgi:abortive infection bacteriophage resistance protein
MVQGVDFWTAHPPGLCPQGHAQTWRVFFCPDDLKFSKPALSYEDQAALLEKRGLIVADRAVLVRRLEAVGYYRLCAYWHPFRQPDDTFLANTTFDMVWQRYRFDRQLRLSVMDAIERVEVAVRTALVHHIAMRFGPFGHSKKVFMLLTLLQQLLNGIVPQTGWRSRVFGLFDRFPEIPLKAMGMPNDWRTHDLWN